MQSKEQKAAYAREWRRRNPEKQRAIRRRGDAKNAEKIRRRRSEYNRTTKNQEYRANYRRRLRGQLEAPTRPKPERCEVRGCLPGKKGLVEDHDHQTGKFRGWPCSNCNAAIGQLGDSLEGILATAKYFG